MNKLTLKKIFGHFGTISRHKWEVFKNSVKVGIVWRGFMHDWSKWSPLEFFSQARYYQGGKFSPIDAEKMERGYSRAWLHHRGRNPHHWEYWVDGLGGEGVPIKMELPYALEMICDFIAAGKVYQGRDFTNAHPLRHTTNALESGFMKLHPKTRELVLAVERDYAENGGLALRRAKETARGIGYSEAESVVDGRLGEIAETSIGLNKK